MLPDTSNKFLVSIQRDAIVIMRPPTRLITREDALCLAAWLVAIADPEGERFAEVLKAIQGT